MTPTSIFMVSSAYSDRCLIFISNPLWVTGRLIHAFAFFELSLVYNFILFIVSNNPDKELLITIQEAIDQTFSMLSNS